jgi:hypothetical protein
MSRRRSTRAAITLGATLAIGFVGACQKPTAVRLELSTNVSCDRTQGVQIFAGKPGTVEGNAPAAEDGSCSSGSLGTIVAQPPEDKSAAAAFRTVLGVTRPVSQCTATDGYAGCIVQRRELRYIEGETLRLPIVFYERCVGVACDPSSTCASNGLCVSAKIADPSTCVPPSICLPTGDPGTPEVPGKPVEAGADATLPDAAVTDAGSDGASQDSSSDAATGDAGTDSDAGSDAQTDSGTDGGKDSGGMTVGETVCANQTCGVGYACCTSKQGGADPICLESQFPCNAAQHAGKLECDQSLDCPNGRSCCLVGGNNMQCLADGVSCPVDLRGCRTNIDCAGAECTAGILVGKVFVPLCFGAL